MSIHDLPAALTRLQFEAMPDYDYATEAEKLRAEGSFGEALIVLDVGIADGAPACRESLQRLRAQVISERDSWFRRAKEFGIGAVVGQGESLESALGAITADMLVIGDVRDSLIQGTRVLVGEDADEFILALSLIGLATTVVPAVDWSAAMLKLTRKSGAISDALAQQLTRVVKRGTAGGDTKALEALISDTASLTEKLSPRGFARVIRHVEDPETIGSLARFVARHADGPFALHVAGRDGVRWIARGDDATVNALLLVSKKGDRGVAWLRSGRPGLLRPHLLIGGAKSLWKGNAQNALNTIAKMMDRCLWLIIPVLLLWVAVECWLIGRAFRNARRQVAVIVGPPLVRAR